MSIQEKLNLVNFFSVLLIFVLYCIYVYQINPELSFDTAINFRFWGRTILMLVPIQIGTSIIINVIFSIINTVATQEESDYNSDEYDRQIEFRATRNACYTFMITFMLSMAVLVINVEPVYMFHTLAFSLFATQFVWLLSEFYFYRKGV